MKKKTWKTAVICVVLLGILAGISTGCSKKEKGQTGGEQAKGRYVEKEIVLPENSGEPLGMLYRDHSLVLYTCSPDRDGYQSFVYEEDKWSDPKEEIWLADGKNRLKQDIVEVFMGRDGNLYARTESETGTRLLREGEHDTAEDVTPPADPGESTPGFTDAAILKNGTVGIGDYRNTMAAFYRDGKLIFSTEGILAGSEDQVMLEANDQTVAVVGRDGTSIEFYDAATFEKKNTVTLDQQFGDGFLVPGRGKIWYLMNKNGIFRITEDGSICERIMDGENGMMSNDMLWFSRRFIMGADAEFYGLYSNADQEWKLMKYEFDEDSSAVQKVKLSVYSLRENRTVSQAVHEFKNEHPEVQIEYITAVTGEEKPTADHIRTLNTELLNGNGADVLILDGLPVESYIEKGVLRDLGEVAGKLEKSGVLKNIVENTVQKDGKIYGIPARINIPVIFGTREEVRACESIDSLKAYAQKHTDRRLFGFTSHDLIGMSLFDMFYDELEEESGRLNEEKLSELLTTWMQLCENGSFKEYENRYFEGESIWHLLDASFCTAQDVMGQSVYASVIELTGLGSLQTPYTTARKTGIPPKSFKGYYVPKTIAGVNVASKQPQLAEEFVECLFTENVQQIDSWDGLPVLDSVLETYPDYVESEEGQKNSMRYQGIHFETGETFEELLTYPTKREMEDLIQMIKESDTPFIQNPMISDTVQQEMEKCYSGKQSPVKTAEEICQKINLYLTE